MNAGGRCPTKMPVLHTGSGYRSAREARAMVRTGYNT